MTFDKEIDFIKKNNLSTPVMFFNETLALEPLSLIKQHLKNTDIYYAVKSCYNVPLLHFFAEQKIGAEVMSELEFDLAKKCKFNNIIVNGMGRSSSFIEKVLKSTDTVFIVDTNRDLNIVKKFLEKNKQEKCRLGIRIRLNDKKKNYSDNHYLDPLNKLGNYTDSDVYRNFLSLIETENRAIWDIVHLHFTINELDPAVYIKIIEQLKQHIDLIKQQKNIYPERIDLGGGFEVYSRDLADKFKTLFMEIETEFSKNFPYQKLAVEPGRFLSAYSGYVFGKIIDIKQVQHKYWLITDIGTNVLIPNSNARYKLLYPKPSISGNLIGVTDGITSGVNNIIEKVFLSKLPTIGDYIIVGNVGGYTDVYSTFWGYSPFIVCNRYENSKIKITRTVKDIKKLHKIFFNRRKG